MEQTRIKFVVVGDTGVGKTSLLNSYGNGIFSEYIGATCDSFAINIRVNKTNVNLSLWDTAGGEEYDRLRPLAYPETDLIMLCFSVDSPTSMKNATEKYFPEVTHHVPDAKIVLVGTKIDLRNDERVVDELKKEEKSPVATEKGEELARELGVLFYKECSAKTFENVQSLFMESLQGALHPPNVEKKICLIL